MTTNISSLTKNILKWPLLLALTLSPIMLTLSDYGVTFDEPIYMEAAWNIKKWLSLEPKKIFDQDEIERYWETDPARNVHPSGVKWLYLIAQKTVFWETDPYVQNAFFNVFIFGISLTVFLVWWTDFQLSTSIIYIIILLSIPRFFAHAHFPATDIPLTSLFLLFIVSMERTVFRHYFWISGIILGVFASIKITSILLIFPIFVLFIIYNRHEWQKIFTRIVLISLIGITIFYLLNPDYWFSPLSRLQKFLIQSVTRRSWTPFTVFFNGEFYDYRAPFYYPFTMFLTTTPILHIIFMLIGFSTFACDVTLRNNLKMLLICTGLMLPFLILTLPISPAHDGVRYMLPCFPFAACFMTFGLKKAWHFIRENIDITKFKRVCQWITAALLLSIFAMDLHSPARYPPFELSYYNRIIGGISGAFRRGYETTYLWEIMNNDVLKRLNEICGGHTVYFPLPPNDFYFKHMIDAKKINFIPTLDLKEAQYMLIIGRPYVKFWEIYTWPRFKNIGKIPIKIWDVSLDSVPLIQLYSI